MLCTECFSVAVKSIPLPPPSAPHIPDSEPIWLALDVSKFEHVGKSLESGDWVGKYLLTYCQTPAAELGLLNWAQALLDTVQAAYNEHCWSRQQPPVREAARAAHISPSSKQPPRDTSWLLSLFGAPATEDTHE
jgi:hypothetical protein